MKKLVIMMLLAFTLIGCSSSQPTNKADMSDYKDIVGNDIRFVQDDFETMVTNMANKKEGIYFVGFSSCPWCMEFVPVLNEVLVEKDATAYYIDVRSEKFTDNIIDKLTEFDNTLGSQASGGSVPFLVIIDGNGKITTHLGTVSGHNAKVAKMTDAQRESLVSILSSIIE